MTPEDKLHRDNITKMLIGAIFFIVIAGELLILILKTNV